MRWLNTRITSGISMPTIRPMTNTPVERGAERRRQPGEHQEQHGGRYPAQQRDQQFHIDESIQNVFIFYIF